MKVNQLTESKSIVLGVALLIPVLSSWGAITGIDLGTTSPPGTVGGYTMVPFELNEPFVNDPDYQSVSSVMTPFGGFIGFSDSRVHYRIGDLWGDWGNGYLGDVYYNEDNTSMTITVPVGTGAFYFYAAPNTDGYSITATANDGSSVTVDGLTFDSANGWGFYTYDTPLTSIQVTSTGDAFAIGQFGIAEFAVPEPTTMIVGALLLLPFGVSAWRTLRRKHTA